MRKYHRHYEAKTAKPVRKAKKAPRKDLHDAIRRRHAFENPRGGASPRYARPSVSAEATGQALLGMFPMPNPRRVRNQDSSDETGIAEILKETGLSESDVKWQELARASALPAQPLDAFTQGVRFGMLTGIELCDINPFSKRSQLRRAIYARLERSFSDADRAYLQRLVTQVEKNTPSQVRFAATAKPGRGQALG